MAGGDSALSGGGWKHCRRSAFAWVEAKRVNRTGGTGARCPYAPEVQTPGGVSTVGAAAPAALRPPGFHCMVVAKARPSLSDVIDATGRRGGVAAMPKDELIVQLIKIALGVAIGGYFVWWSLEVLHRLPPQ